MKSELAVSIIQTNLKWEDAQANRELFSSKIESITGETDLIVLPEMFTTGFSMNASNLAENNDGETLKWMQRTARVMEAAITGSVIITENGLFYNRLYFVFPDGSYDYYDTYTPVS